MKLIAKLHELGILRAGATDDTSKNSKDMPDELKLDNVNGNEQAPAGGSGAEENVDAVTPGRSSELLFAILFVVSIVITLFFGLMVDLGFWFFVLAVILLVFIFMLHRYLRGLCSLKTVWTYFFVYIVLSVAVLFIAIPGQEEDVEDAGGTSSQNAAGVVSQAEDIDESE